MKHISAICLLLATISCSRSVEPYKNPSAPIEDRVEDLLSRMTLEEKIWQMTQGFMGKNDNPNNVAHNFIGKVSPMVGSMINYGTTAETGNILQKIAIDSTRLGIPILYGYDAIHGFHTSLPIPLAQAASFNTELAQHANEITARECYAAGIHWTFSPMTDIARDPRWGRIMEGYGEDPYVASRFTAAAVKAYQGDNPSKPGHIAACLKHYVGYGASEAGRDYTAVDISRQLLWDTYLPPFQAGVEAGAMTFMSAFNTLSGIPASANKYTLTRVRKALWHHDGFVVSDWGAVEQLILQGTAADREQSAMMAVNAGLEMDMCDFVYVENLEALVEKGLVDIKVIDEAVRRILRVKFRLGLFENPFRDVVEVKDVLSEESFTTAEALAQESMVLLKNNGTLPLDKSLNIALVGPLADDKDLVIGSWRAHALPENTISIREAMCQEFSHLTDRVTASTDVIVLCLGEGKAWTGENKTRASISLPEDQEILFRKMVATGKPVVVVFENGRPLDLTRIEPSAAAILEIWCPGHRGGPAVSGILSGRYNPSGKLPVCFPYGLGQVPVYYGHRDRCRRGKWGEYIDGTPLKPLYDFGWGLSYSTFEYSDITLDGLKASVTVTNTSGRDGKETVLWYIQDPACSIARPVKELKFFEKKEIKAGQSVEFTFEIDKMRDLGFVNSDGERFFEPGEFVLMASDKKQLTFKL